jgi:hypothetical protein
MPDPRCFDHFPKDSVCPVCATNYDGKTVLVPIVGTEDDGICQAKPMHLGCAVVKRWHDDMRVGTT